MEEAEGDMVDDREELEDEDANMNYSESRNQMIDQGNNADENAQELLAAAGLEDSDAEDAVRIHLHLSFHFSFGLVSKNLFEL